MNKFRYIRLTNEKILELEGKEVDLIVTDLKQQAEEIRLRCFKAITNAGGGHYGGSMSECEILTVLYFDEMNIDPKLPKMETRDKFILSKGHGGPGLYTTLSARGYFEDKLLDELDANGSRLPKHVDRLKLQGVDVSSGSLGQGLSIGNGLALAARIKKSTERVYVLMGDGELDEGQVWEAAMTSAKYGLDNLVAIIDANKNQVDGPVCEVMPTDIIAKWKASRWNVIEADGHDVKDLKAAFAQARQEKGRPSVIVAHTIKGKGISFMEDNYLWHSGCVSKEQYEIAIKDLEARM
jgi:transketolase